MAITLCSTDDIADPGSRGFSVELAGETMELFIVHKDGQFHGYHNQCPHTGVNLEFQPDEFLDLERRFIICSNHGALFECETGQCIAGPCTGDSLTAVNIAVEGGNLVLVTA